MKLEIAQARNPVMMPNGSVNMEILHPEAGWIPFLASPDDAEEHGRDLHARALALEFGPLGDVVPIPNPRVSEILSRLSQIDIESIRALRGITVGRGRPGDNAALSALENEAEILRAELATTPEFV